MRRAWRRIGVVAVALIMATPLFGCTSSSDDGPTSVPIGLVVPLSGDLASFGNEARQGAELAVDLINGEEQELALPLLAEQGIPSLGGSPVELVVADSASDATKAVNEVGRLVNESSVVAIVGAYDGDVTAAASQRAERLGVPFVNGDSSRGFLTQRGLEWFFRVGPSDEIVGESLLSLLDRASPDTEGGRVGLVHPDERQASDVAFDIAAATTSAGYEVVEVPVFDDGVDLAALEASGDLDAAVTVALDATTAANLTSQLKGASVLAGAPVIGIGAGFEDPSFAGRAQEAASDVLVATDWSAEMAERNTLVSSVAGLYQQRYSTPLTADAAVSFTSIYALGRAINDAASLDRIRVRGALEGLDIPGRELIMPWDGIRFDATHQNAAARGVVNQVREDGRVLVHPVDLAREAVRWPTAPAAG